MLPRFPRLRTRSKWREGNRRLTARPCHGCGDRLQGGQVRRAGFAYDGLLEGAKIAFYVSFDNTKVGELQGQYLVQHLAKGSTVVMVNGDQTSAPGVAFKQGALQALAPSLLKSGQLKLGYSADTPEFTPATAETEMEQALTKLSNDVAGGSVRPTMELLEA